MDIIISRIDNVIFHIDTAMLRRSFHFDAVILSSRG
jgi:hypothetical protein